jgi:hypothetical protein
MLSTKAYLNLKPSQLSAASGFMAEYCFGNTDHGIVPSQNRINYGVFFFNFTGGSNFPFTGLTGKTELVHSDLLRKFRNTRTGLN